MWAQFKLLIKVLVSRICRKLRRYFIIGRYRGLKNYFTTGNVTDGEFEGSNGLGWVDCPLCLTTLLHRRFSFLCALDELWLETCGDGSILSASGGCGFELMNPPLGGSAFSFSAFASFSLLRLRG